VVSNRDLPRLAGKLDYEERKRKGGAGQLVGCRLGQLVNGGVIAFNWEHEKGEWLGWRTPIHFGIRQVM
jgi:hypothetical protein